MAAVAQVGRDEVLEGLFIDVPLPLDRLRVVIVFDVYPADARLHRQVLLEHFGRRVALRDDVAGVENEHAAPDGSLAGESRP